MPPAFSRYLSTPLMITFCSPPLVLNKKACTLSSHGGLHLENTSSLTDSNAHCLGTSKPVRGTWGFSSPHKFPNLTSPATNTLAPVSFNQTYIIISISWNLELIRISHLISPFYLLLIRCLRKCHITYFLYTIEINSILYDSHGSHCWITKN